MKRWGDDLDDSDDEQPQQSSGNSGDVDLPPTHKSKVDFKGIQIVTSYRAHPSGAGKLIKTVTKVRVNYVKVREAKAVAERRTWKKFGQAALDEDTSNVTIHSRDDVYMEDPNADTDLQDEDPEKALGNLNAFWQKQKQRHLERKYDVDQDADADPNQLAPAAGGGGWTQVGSSSGGSGGKYVPPSQRGGAVGTAMKTQERTDDLNTIRVTNISENTTEADLQDLFQPFGRISRVYLAKDKETMISRGFAFVSFVHKEDAARAMEKLQGFGYDHLILKLEWARPNAPKDPGASGTEYRSGYGKALAQDTKEKVSYASNLTKGVR
mmetsp:Transcript_3177/g.4701  ORF Transcript_3177/g.4701 Transcript_3177/m.4701 type:complete len:324 (-) Transcript_3177:82-1053(-)|eukprot:CAMPEP_0194210390 /NCGR_PEP_ID=MMETSP0156-20130528/8304_1 /TAXON_ID=33649 /ORGANISM="Thalassionema nitzschioides, Strain L26-B" /LENGTH=323 /DNA_ID=CAMNT_0038937727 /DNA_START=55 /DNA_END=1026 /DNA_ORIENTATION=+